MDQWKQFHGDTKGLEKLTYEPVFHWHGIVSFIIYMGSFTVMFFLFRFLVGLI